MKGLIIYFSHIGENWLENGLEVITKGNTEIVAEKLAKLTGSELFKVETKKEYAFGYYDCCKEAKKEYKEDARPELKTELSDISNYDTIFIGSPIWWDHLPMAMFTQLEKLNFEGKTVYTFITHEGSGLGSTMKDVNKLCHGAKIKDGLAIRGCKAEESDILLKDWIK